MVFFKLKEIVENVIMKCPCKIVLQTKKRKGGVVIIDNTNRVLEVNLYLITLRK